jgi:hypothetical protein
VLGVKVINKKSRGGTKRGKAARSTTASRQARYRRSSAAQVKRIAETIDAEPVSGELMERRAVKHDELQAAKRTRCRLVVIFDKETCKTKRSSKRTKIAVTVAILSLLAGGAKLTAALLERSSHQGRAHSVVRERGLQPSESIATSAHSVPR